jgi:hypothetical protein
MDYNEPDSNSVRWFMVFSQQQTRDVDVFFMKRDVDVRPVSLGVSCPSLQHSHMLETMQKSFISMKLSLLS